MVLIAVIMIVVIIVIIVIGMVVVITLSLPEEEKMDPFYINIRNPMPPKSKKDP